MKKKGDLKETDRGANPETVDEYIAAAPLKEHQVLEDLRRTIKAAAPEAEETISYRIPTYKYKGPLVHFAVFKNHNSFIVVNKSILETFQKELEDFPEGRRKPQAPAGARPAQPFRTQHTGLPRVPPRARPHKRG